MSWSILVNMAIAVLLTVRYGVNAHGTMVDPISRNSLWRVDSSAPVNYDDIELYCGGISVCLEGKNTRACVKGVCVWKNEKLTNGSPSLLVPSA